MGRNIWTPQSWREKPSLQIPTYENLQKLKEVEDVLKTYPPLVFAGEVRALKRKLAQVCNGEAFLLQGGDCAESFSEHSADNIRDFLRVFLQMAVVLTFGASCPVVKVGRIAGQFAKPRSNTIETRGDVSLPSYRGDIINGPDFTPEDRYADPYRQERAYRQSAATLNLVRAMMNGGYANLGNVAKWILVGLEKGAQLERYQALSSRIVETMNFMKAIGISMEEDSTINRADLYTSHEALLLGYEQALTREDSVQGGWYATSGHFLWIGDRTRQFDHAHVEYCRGIENPIGIKCGPSMTTDELLMLLDILNPRYEHGRITLITRFGHQKIGDHLPQLIRAVQESGHPVIWSCDPMHGNTITVSGYKTRPFEYIMSELEQFFMIHQAEKTYPGGVHLEMTGKDVTECTGGLASILPEELQNRYHTHCDPRLNANQALELSFAMVDRLTMLKNKDELVLQGLKEMV